MLQGKEHRLCSQQYKQNDYQFSRLGPDQTVTTRADKHSRDYQGHFVYADDATDIKAHPFFHGLSWERLHLSRPPFVPDVKGRDDTKYFDEEEPISDVDDASSTCSALEHEAAIESIQKIAPAVHTLQLDGANAPRNKTGSRKADKDPSPGMAQANGKSKATKPKEKKRPRDRALRDPQVGRTVLELRKRGAFLGYTYRRPRVYTYGEERGRRSATRRSIIPSLI